MRFLSVGTILDPKGNPSIRIGRKGSSTLNPDYKIKQAL
jgi:hypothetical protein